MKVHSLKIAGGILGWLNFIGHELSNIIPSNGDTKDEGQCRIGHTDLSSELPIVSNWGETDMDFIH